VQFAHFAIMVNTKAHPLTVRPAEETSSTLVVDNTGSHGKPVAAPFCKAPRSGPEIKHMFSTWEPSAQHSGSIASYDEPLLVAILRNQNVLHTIISNKMSPPRHPMRWCGAPSNGREVQSYSVDWKLSAPGSSAEVSFNDEPLMVAILRNQEALLVALSSGSGKNGGAGPVMTEPPSSGTDLKEMFMDWKLSAPGEAAHVSIYAEPLLVAILQNQEILLDMLEGKPPSSTALAKAPASGAELKKMSKGWKLSAPADQSATVSRHAEALLCAILGNQEALRQRLIGAAPPLEVIQFVFHDLSLELPPAACCIIL